MVLPTDLVRPIRNATPAVLGSIYRKGNGLLAVRAVHFFWAALLPLVLRGASVLALTESRFALSLSAGVDGVLVTCCGALDGLLGLGGTAVGLAGG
jgi:hypothetical protein